MNITSSTMHKTREIVRECTRGTKHVSLPNTGRWKFCGKCRIHLIFGRLQRNRGSFYLCRTSTFLCTVQECSTEADPIFWKKRKRKPLPCTLNKMIKMTKVKFMRILIILIYLIIKSMRALWLVNQLWFIVLVNSWKFRVSSELLFKSNRPQVSMVYRLINHAGCWKNTRRIRKSLACGSWFTNSSSVLGLLLTCTEARVKWLNKTS